MCSSKKVFVFCLKNLIASICTVGRVIPVIPTNLFFDFFFSVPGVDLFSTISVLLGVIAAFIVAVPLIYCIRYKDVLKHDVGPKRSGILV